MKFEWTDRFAHDRDRLSRSELTLFLRVARNDFSPACDRYAADPTAAWPGRLRVKPVRGQPGVLEMTWSFSGPDGRATFELVTVEGELHVRWRRVGGHDIFHEP